MTPFSQIFTNTINDLKKYAPLILSIITACIINQLIFHKICPIAIFTGFPCPGCGITRAFYYLITLRWHKALTMNPCIFLWIILIIILFINRYILTKKFTTKTINTLLIATGIVSILIYIFRMINMYPNIEPLTYYNNNILHNIHYIATKIISNFAS